MCKLPIKYNFPDLHENIEKNKYCIFPSNMEKNNLIFFHGTAESNLVSIIKNGFVIPNDLKSISFSRKSDLALKYACNARNTSSPCGVVLAVQFCSIENKHISIESFGLYVYDQNHMPKIIGYCIIPANYLYR